jgi:hypothetical protein
MMEKRMKRTLATAMLAATVLLTACGGGDDDRFIPPPGDFNALAAWQNLLDPPALRSWTNIVGRGSDGNEYALTLAVEAAPNATFPLTGEPFFVTNVYSTIAGNGTPLGDGLTEIFFDADWYVRGLRVSSTTIEPGGGIVTSTTCDEVLATALPPAAAQVGTSGALYDATIRETCTAGAPASGASAVTWSIEFELGIVFMCIATEDRGFGIAPVVTTEQDCIEIQADGTLGARARIILTGNSPPFELVARNY